MKLKEIFKNKWIKMLLMVFGSFVYLSLWFYSIIYFGAFGKLPTTEELKILNQAEATTVLDNQGFMIGKYFIYDRQPITYDQLPPYLINALIATEDARFFEHDGVDHTSLVRVFFKTILLGDSSAGGGSTLTQQLAKNLFGREKYKFFSIVVNKIKESFTARRIEEIYSKEEIITLYFNTVPFPDNTYGIESASKKFFNKTTKNLTLSEAATLVGTLKANHSYNPRLFPERSQLRRDVVIKQMQKYGYLSNKETQNGISQPIALNYQYFDHDQGLAPYFREEVKKEAVKLLKQYHKPDGSPYDIYRDGLIIHTTLDASIQFLAEQSMKEHLKELQQQYEKSYGTKAPWKINKKLVAKQIYNLPAYEAYKKEGLSTSQIMNTFAAKRKQELFDWTGTITKEVSVIDSLQHYLKFLNAGMLAIDPKTGAIKSYIGGIDYRYFKFDHVSQSKRQVGSTFKPFVYTSAIEKGIKPCTYFSVKEVTYTNLKGWTPKNASATNDPHLNYSLETALSNSVNTIAVKVLNQVGISNVIKLAHSLGIQEKIPEQPSIALGSASIKINELAGAYASYVNKGKSVRPFSITKIEDRQGNSIASFEPEIAREAAYSEYTRQVMLEMMKSTVNRGTASRLRSVYGLSNDIAGKTGTTQDNKDGWFVAITPNLIVITWVGNDNYSIGFKTTKIGQGANSALPIFAKLYQKMNADPNFDMITQSTFEKTSPKVLQDLNCRSEKRDNFLKRLFYGDKKKKRKRRFKKR